MTEQVYGKSYGASPAENYQRFLSLPSARRRPTISSASPVSRRASACSTSRAAPGSWLAAERVGAAGAVVGLDVNPAMLAVARSHTPPDLSIEWREASAESMPLADEAFDVVLCQMGLRFIPDKLAALREMRRVLETGGRVFVTAPGPKPPMFAIMTDALARHLNPQAAAFVDLVFSMHDGDELAELMRGAGFRDVDVQADLKTIRVPAPADFLWQYIHSTPLAEAAAQAGETGRDALERDVCARRREFTADGAMSLQARMTTARRH